MTLQEWQKKYDPRFKDKEDSVPESSKTAGNKSALAQWQEKYVPKTATVSSPVDGTKSNVGGERFRFGMQKTPLIHDAPTVTVKENTTADGYYSKPDLWGDADRYEKYLTIGKAQISAAETAANDAKGTMDSLYADAERLHAMYVASQSPAIYGQWEKAVSDYDAAHALYDTAVTGYKDAAARYNSVLGARDSYLAGEQEKYDAWRGTVRPQEQVQAERAAVQLSIDALEKQKTAMYADTKLSEIPAKQKEIDAQIAQLKEKMALLDEEYDWARYFGYEEMRSAEDFGEKSKYVPNKTGEAQLNLTKDFYITTGYADDTYEQINKNQDVIGKLGVNYTGTGMYAMGGGDRELSQLTDDEIAIFNYLYKKDEEEGDDQHTSAYEYLDYIRGDLNYRQRMADAEKTRQYAKEHPVASSVASVALAPMKAFSTLGQVADYLDDKKIDENAGYNKFSHIPSDIRGEVSGIVEDKWGKVGSYAYNTGMSIADSVFNTAVAGAVGGAAGLSKAGTARLVAFLMGSEIMADEVIQSKKRGLSDDQAFTKGIVSAVIEAATEKFSVEALLDKITLGKNALGYWLKNVLTEAGEEGASNIANTLADVLISRDKSEWQTAIDAYRKDGFSDKKAFGKALGDQAVSLGLDMLGGAISGSVMATPVVAVSGLGNAGHAYAEHVRKKESMDKPNAALRAESTDRFEPVVEANGSYEDENGNTVRTDGTKITKTGKIIAPTAESKEQGKRMKAAKTDTARTGIASGATDGQIKTAERLSKILKKDIRFFREGADENGNITNGFYEGNVIYVNTVGAKTVKWVVGHELTHSAELSEKYGDLQTYVLKQMKRAGIDVDEKVRDTINLYESHGATLNENEAKQEIVSDYAADYLFTDERAIRELVRGRPDLGQRILNWIDGFLASYGNENAEERLLLQKAKGLYAKALSDADKLRNDANAGKNTATAGKTEPGETASAADRYQLNPEELRSEEGGRMPPDDEADIDPDALDASIREHHPEAKLSVSRTAAENEQILSRMRSILQNGGSAADLRSYVNTLDAEERTQAKKKPQGTNTQRREDAASQIVRAAHRADMSVEEYLRENAELYETEDGWNAEARRALQMEGRRYSIGGVNAAGADMDALSRAKEMDAQGVAEDTILQSTGWYKGADGKWRFEIDDSRMEYHSAGDAAFMADHPEYAEYQELVLKMLYGTITPEEEVRMRELSETWGRERERLNQRVEGGSATLKNLIKHDELFKNYPGLRNTRVEFADLLPGENGSYNATRDVITLSSALRRAPESTLLHEIQHVIQRIEGFAGGASVEYWTDRYKKEAETAKEKADEKYRQLWDALPDKAKNKFREINLAKMDADWDLVTELEDAVYESEYAELYSEITDADFERRLARERTEDFKKRGEQAYFNTAGEIEARDVSDRRKMTAEERRAKIPNRGGENVVFAEREGEEYSITEPFVDSNGNAYKYAVLLDTDVFNGVSPRNWGTVLKEKLIKRAKKDPVILPVNDEKGNATLLQFGKPRERVTKNGSGNHPVLGELYSAKDNIGKLTVIHIDEIVNVSEESDPYFTIENKHGWMDKNGWLHRNANVINAKNGNIYNITMDIAKTEDGRTILYALNGKTKKVGNVKVDSLKIKGPRQNSNYAKSISQSAPIVNRKLSVSSADEKSPTEPTIAKRDFVRNLTAMFSIPEGLKKKVGEMISEAAQMILDNGRLDEASRRSFFDYLYSSGVMTVLADEYYRNIRSAVKGGKLYVSEDVKAEFGDDWNAFRRKAFDAGVILTNDANAGKIDVWHQELAELFPGSFSAENTDMRDMLESIVSLAEKGKSEKISLAEYAARAADANFISEKEYMFDMERRFDEELRLFAEKAELETVLRDKQGAANQAKAQLQKERDRNAEAWKKHREQLAAQREQKQMRELQQKTLKALQWLYANRNRAPEELRAKYEEVLADIDIYAVGAANEMRLNEKYGATWRDLSRMYKEARENDPNFFPSKELDKIVSRLDNEKIGDLDINALRDLYQAATALRTEFYNRNNVLGEMNYQLFDDLYITVGEEIDSAPAQKLESNFFNKAQLSAANFLRRMVGWNPESTFYKMAKMLEDGEYAMHRYEVDARREIDEFAKKYPDWVRRADGQGKDGIWITKTVPRLAALRFGEAPVFDGTVEIAMTPMMRIHMYLESKNVENLRHMAGGRTFADKDLYAKGKREEAFAKGDTVRLAPETVKNLLLGMSKEELELANILHKYYNGYAKQEINRVSNILYGYDKAISREYAPIYTNKNYVTQEPGVYNVTAEGAGNLKARQHSGNPSYQIGAMDAFDKHVDRTAKFVGYAIPIRNWTTLLNWREKGDSMRDKISHKWGKQGINYIDQVLENLQTGSAKVTEDDLSGFFGKVYSNTIGAVFGLNPSVVTKQFGSMAMAGAELDYRNIPKPKQIKAIDKELIFRYTGELAYRASGNASAEMQLMRNNPNWAQRNKAIRFATGEAITATDQWTASVLWPWAENKVRREHPGLEVGTEAQIKAGESEFYKKVAEEFNSAVSHSQSVSDEMHQSQMRKSKNTITRTFTMFKSDAAQGYNQLRKNIGEAQFYDRISKDKSKNESARREAAEKAKKAKKKVGATVVGILINNAWATTMTLLMALWKNKGKNYRDDEDELTVQSVMQQWSSDFFSGIAGTVALGEEIAEFIGNTLTGERWYDIEAPGVDVVNDLFKLFGDSLVGAGDFFSRGRNVLRDGGDVGKFLAQNAGEIVGGLKDTAVQVSSYFGIPAKNLETYLLGTFQWIAPGVATAYEDLLDSPERADLAGLKGKALDQRVADIMKVRGVTLDKNASDTLAAMYDAGEKGVIPSDIPSSFTVDGESYTLTETQKQRYSAVWAETVDRYLQKLIDSTEFRHSDFKDKIFMIGKVYKLGAEYAKKKVVPEYEIATWAEEVSAFEKAKLSIPKYLETQAAYSNIYDKEGDGKLKALDFARWVMKQKFTKAQREVVRECFGQGPVKYYEFIDAGVSENGAYRLAKEFMELKPMEGRETVSVLQKARAVVDEQLPAAEELAALSQIMTESEYAKVKAGNAHGITPGVYVTFKELLPQYDADGNGTYSQEEVERAIDSIGPKFRIVAPSYGSSNAKNTNLTNAQRAVLWQMANKSWKPESNPYSVWTGRKVYEDLNK